MVVSIGSVVILARSGGQQWLCGCLIQGIQHFYPNSVTVEEYFFLIAVMHELLVLLDSGQHALKRQQQRQTGIVGLPEIFLANVWIFQ